MSISADQARQIAEEVVSGRVAGDIWFYVLLLATTFVAGAAGAFLSSYFKKRGEALATKSDFNDLLEQLRESTHLAEEIKADVQSRYGETASVRALLRERTEALVMATFDLEQWLEQARSRVIDGEPLGAESSPMSKISALRDIYFPEVVQEYFELQRRFLRYSHWLVSLQAVRLQGGNDLQPVRTHMDGFGEIYQPFLASLSPFRAQVIASSRQRGGL